MIDIKAKNDGDAVVLQIEVAGKGSDIVWEFAAVMIELPAQLNGTDPKLFRAATEEFRAQIENVEERIMERKASEEVQDGAKQN